MVGTGVLAVVGVLSWRAGFLGFLVITIFRALANLYRNNVLPVEAAQRFPFDHPDPTTPTRSSPLVAGLLTHYRRRSSSGAVGNRSLPDRNSGAPQGANAAIVEEAEIGPSTGTTGVSRPGVAVRVPTRLVGTDRRMWALCSRFRGRCGAELLR